MGMQQFTSFGDLLSLDWCLTQGTDLSTAFRCRQRASQGGLIVSEGTSPSPGGRGYMRAPNLYDKASLDGWRLVTDRVHARGGLIFCQA
jgi:2,4-dienoyl-CoA reductase-like NADH-dependent reductase (Old Yellow Enzyme family)